MDNHVHQVYSGLEKTRSTNFAGEIRVYGIQVISVPSKKVRSYPESRHNKYSAKESAFDPKLTLGELINSAEWIG